MAGSEKRFASGWGAFPMATPTPALESLLWASRRPNHASAWHGHVAFVHWIINAAGPQLIVELGTEHGISYAAMCHAVAALALPARCFAVDTWEGDAHTVAYDASVYNDLKAFNDTHYAGFSTLLRCKFDEALTKFDPRSIDLLHIDGLHTYEAVKHDFDTWLPKMSDSGIILFHDTSVRTGDFGVWRFWEEVQRSYPTFTFEHSAGLGVAIVGPSPPAAIAALCRVTDLEEVSELRNAFEFYSDFAQRLGKQDQKLQILQQKISSMQEILRKSAVELALAADR